MRSATSSPIIVVALEHAGAPEDERQAALAAGALPGAALVGDVVGGKVEAGRTAGLITSVIGADRIVAECRAMLAALRIR